MSFSACATCFICIFFFLVYFFSCGKVAVQKGYTFFNKKFVFPQNSLPYTFFFSVPQTVFLLFPFVWGKYPLAYCVYRINHPNCQWYSHISIVMRSALGVDMRLRMRTEMRFVSVITTGFILRPPAVACLFSIWMCDMTCVLMWENDGSLLSLEFANEKRMAFFSYVKDFSKEEMSLFRKFAFWEFHF